MSLFGSKKKVYVASSAAPVIELNPKPELDAIVTAIFEGRRSYQGIIEEGINNFSSRLDQVYKYGEQTYHAGLPQSSYKHYRPDNAAIKASLENTEFPSGMALTDKIRLHTVKLERDDPELNLLDHLITQYDYDTVTRRLPSVPAGTIPLMDTDRDAYLAGLATPDPVVFDALRASVPVNRVEESPVTIDTVAYTKVDTIEVNTTEAVKVIPVVKRKHIVDTWEENADAIGNVVFTVNLQSIQTIETKVVNTISYVETITTQYRAADNSLSAPVYEARPPQRVADINDAITSFTYTDSFDYTPIFNRTALFYFIEYSVITAQETVKKHLYFPLLNPTTGEINPGGFPVDATEAVGKYYPVVMLRDNNVNLFTEARSNDIEYIQAQKMFEPINLSVREVADSVYANPDIDQIDYAFLMFGVNLQTENEGCIRYLVEFFKEQYQRDIANYANPNDLFRRDLIEFGGNPRPVSELAFKEGNLDMTLQWHSIKVEFYQGKIGKKDTVTKELMLTGSEGFGAMVLQHQVDNDTVYKITVQEPQVVNKVYQNHVTMVRIKDLLDPEAGEDENSLIIPLDRAIVNSLNVFIRDNLYYDSIHLVFYSYEVQSVKWYQTGIFKVLMVVVAVVIFIVTGYAPIAELSAIFAAQGLLAALIYVAKTILIGIIIRTGFRYVVELVGTEIAFIAAIVATVAAVFTGDASFITEVWADNLLQASLGLTDAIAKSIQNDLIDLQNAIELFADKADKLTEELDRVEDLLSVDSLLDPFVFIETQPLIDFNETPDQYFDRTIHIQNVGITAYDAIESYVDVQLQLPKPKMS